MSTLTPESRSACIVGFALIVVYMTFAAVFLVIKGIINLRNNLQMEGNDLTLSDVFTNAIFRSKLFGVAHMSYES